MENFDFEYENVIQNMNSTYKFIALDDDVIRSETIGQTIDCSVAQLLASLGEDPLYKEFYIYETDTYRNTGKILIKV